MGVNFYIYNLYLNSCQCLPVSGKIMGQYLASNIENNLNDKNIIMSAFEEADDGYII